MSFDFIFWIVNGCLVVVYLLIEQLFSVLLLAALIPFVLTLHDFLKNVAYGVMVLAFVTSLLAPTPVPAFLLLMAVSGWIVKALEKFNKLDASWEPMRNIGLYAALGLAYWLFRTYGGPFMPDTSDPILAQGASYLSAGFGIAMYIAPIGFLTWSLKNLLAHPGLPGGTPEELIATVRTGGRQR